jgi:hypothetical protein
MTQLMPQLSTKHLELAMKKYQQERRAKKKAAGKQSVGSNESVSHSRYLLLLSSYSFFAPCLDLVAAPKDDAC